MHKNSKIIRQDDHIENVYLSAMDQRQHSIESATQSEMSGQTEATQDSRMTMGSSSTNTSSSGCSVCRAKAEGGNSSGDNTNKPAHSQSNHPGNHQCSHAKHHHNPQHSHSSHSNNSARSTSTKSTGSQCSAEIEAKERKFGSINLHPLPETGANPECFPGNFRYKIQRMGTLPEKNRQIQITYGPEMTMMYKEGGAHSSDQPLKPEMADVIKDGWNSKVGITPAKSQAKDSQTIKLQQTTEQKTSTGVVNPQECQSTSNSSSSSNTANPQQQLSNSGGRKTMQPNSGNTQTIPGNSSNRQRMCRIGDYILEKTIGKGNFAVVKLATHQHIRNKTAIKIMNKTLIGLNNLEKVTREIDAMKSVEHPHIIKLYQVLETDTKIFMVMEYAEKGEVFDHISHAHAFTEKDARELFWQVVCAIHYCHKSGVVHRDLKAENLLLNSNYQIKVADFGFSNFFESNKSLSTHCGSPQYAAPELFRGDLYDGPLADVWSLGVVLYIMVCGSFPFPGENLGDIRSQVLRGLVRFPFFLSTSCEYLVRGMLQVDPAKRFRIEQIINTPWMQASTNIDKYKALMESYSKKAIELKFEEIFHRQHPEHSDIIREQSYHASKVKIDAALLQALQFAGYDEDEVKNSVKNRSFDKSYAAYYLLKDKVCRFFNHPTLRLFMDAAHSRIIEIAIETEAIKQHQHHHTHQKQSDESTCSSSSTSSMHITSKSTNSSASGSSNSSGSTTVAHEDCPHGHTNPFNLQDTAKCTNKDDIDAVMSSINEQNKKVVMEIQTNDDIDDELGKIGGFGKKPGLAGSYYNTRRDSLTYVRGKLVAAASVNTTNVTGSSTIAEEERRNSASSSSGGSRRTSVKSVGSNFTAPLTGSTTTSRSSSIAGPEVTIDPVSTFSRLYYWVLESDEEHLLRLAEAAVVQQHKQRSGWFDENMLKLQQSLSSSVRRHTVQLTETPNELLRTVTDLASIATKSGFPILFPDNAKDQQMLYESENSTIKEAEPLHEEPMNTADESQEIPTSSNQNVQVSNFQKSGTSSCTAAFRFKQMSLDSTQSQNTVKLNQQHTNTKLMRNALLPATATIHHHQHHHHHYHPYHNQQTSSPLSSHKETMQGPPNTSAVLPSLSSNQQMVLPEIAEITPPYNPGQVGDNNSSHFDYGHGYPIDSGMQMNVQEQLTQQSSSAGPPTIQEHAEMTNDFNQNQNPCHQHPQIMGSNDSMTGSSKLIHNLPQLNLPANLPALQNQPMAKFTIKDPHLLAPPDFMTPYSSCFPRRSSDGAADMQPLHRSNPGVGGSYPEQTAHWHRTRASQNESLYDAVVKQVLPNTKENLGGEISPLEFMGLHLKRFSLPMSNISYQLPNSRSVYQQIGNDESGLIHPGQGHPSLPSPYAAPAGGLSEIACGAASIDYRCTDLLTPQQQYEFRRGSEDSQMSLWHRRVARSGYIDSRSDGHNTSSSGCGNMIHGHIRAGGTSAPSSRGSSPYPRQDHISSNTFGGSCIPLSSTSLIHQSHRRTPQTNESSPTKYCYQEHKPNPGKLLENPHQHESPPILNIPTIDTIMSQASSELQNTQVASPKLELHNVQITQPDLDLQELKTELQNLVPASNENCENKNRSIPASQLIIPSISLSPSIVEDNIQNEPMASDGQDMKSNEKNIEPSPSLSSTKPVMEPLYISSEDITLYQKQMYFHWFPGFIRSATVANQQSVPINQSNAPISSDQLIESHDNFTSSDQYQSNNTRSISSPQHIMLESQQEFNPTNQNQTSCSLIGPINDSQFIYHNTNETVNTSKPAPVPPPLPYYSPFIRDEDAADLAAIERVNRKISSASSNTQHSHISIGGGVTHQPINQPISIQSDFIGQNLGATLPYSDSRLQESQSALELFKQPRPLSQQYFQRHKRPNPISTQQQPVLPRQPDQKYTGHALLMTSDSMDCEPPQDPPELSTIDEQMDSG